MTNFKIVFPRAAAAIMVSLLLVSTATAELGANSSTVVNDAVRLKATPRVTANSRFAVHEMTAATGTVVREYASPSGVVFAVAWSGPYKPDLRQLMGRHFDTYIQQAQLRRARGTRRIQAGNLVVELSGHARDFHGRAYLADSVPAGVDVKEIQ